MKSSTNIIIKPLFTEKMSRLEETERKYAFQVVKNTNKIEIKKAVEKKFNVEVSKVSTLNLKGKKKTMTVKSGGKTIRTSGFTKKWKKAIVTLKKDFSIDLIDGASEA
tara:strand:+ start:13097 stop:13420 length:324 start_codon:yes stop_codon:yes gene_type:complete